MRFIDIKTAPSNTYEEWQHWLNWVQTRLIIMGGKHIEVEQADNEEDWEYVLFNKSTKRKVLTVF